MKKLKNRIKLVESYVKYDSDVIEEINTRQEPDFSILDVTVIPDETYNPTVQSILIDLVETQALKESSNLQLGFNILSETVNNKTGYSHTLLEFESIDKSITLNLSMTESVKYNGVFNVKAHTTRGKLVFESNTRYPFNSIRNYLDSLTDNYLVEREEVKEPDPVEEDINDIVIPTDTTYFIRRPKDLDDLVDKVDKKLVVKSSYQIVDTVELSNEEYDEYTSNLRQDTKFLATFRPDASDEYEFTCIEVTSGGKPTLLIDNSGYDSAQYVGIV